MTAERITKARVVELATRQSQRAQSITRALRAHAWTTTYDRTDRDRPVSRATTDAERLEWLERALRAARAVEQDAAAVRSWIEAYARQEGADTTE